MYGSGAEAPSRLDTGRATALATFGVCTGALAGVLLHLDGVELDRRVNVVVPAATNGGGGRAGVRRVSVVPTEIVEVAQLRCTDGPTTLWALAHTLTDDAWEQALESALRTKIVDRTDVVAMARRTERRAARVRRVIRTRGGIHIVATESLLETLMVQLARRVPGLPPPLRQVEIYNEHGDFVARVDLAWPELGIFIELDGQQHRGQPVYDASRQTAIIAATGWLCGRFTWREVTRTPEVTKRRLYQLHRQARLRPVA